MSDEKLEAYRRARLACELARQLLSDHDLDGILDAISRADSVGALVDPTLYREKVDAMHEDRAVFEAARRFLKTWPAAEPESHGERRSLSARVDPERWIRCAACAAKAGDCGND